MEISDNDNNKLENASSSPKQVEKLDTATQELIDNDHISNESSDLVKNAQEVNNIADNSVENDIDPIVAKNTELKDNTENNIIINCENDNKPTSKDVSNKIIEENSRETDSEIEADWLSTNLEDATDRETILNYVNRLQKFVKKQNKKIKKLRSKLKYYKNKFKNRIGIDAETQVCQEISEQKVESKSIADEIKEAAEQAVAQSTFVYEATSGMYYDYTTGYYYNAELGLYYDGHRGNYLKYDEQTKTYHFHSQVETQQNNYMEDAYGKRKHTTTAQAPQDVKRKKRRRKTKKTNNKALEDGECTTSSSSDSESEEILSISSDDDDMDARSAAGDSEKCAPCVRLIVRDTETESKRVKAGQLHIVTVDGGTIGREGDHSVLLAEVGVSRIHAKISYDENTQKYSVKDCGSRNGTWLDGEKIQANEMEKQIKHGSVLKCGTISLTCHIHEGKRTCGHCEPGLLTQEDQKHQKSAELPKADKKSAYRRELKRLRNKYGFCPQASIAPKVEMAEGYSDKAENRRKFVGSWGIYEKTEVATVTDSIKPTNKGFKLLEKMGWSEGQSLGKTGEGITEPIHAVANQGSAGLGSTDPVPITADPKAAAKTEVWLKTKERYNRILQSSAHPAFAPESEEETEELT